MNLTRPAWVTNTIQSLPNQVTGQATAVKIAFDKSGNDIKTYTDNLCDEIESQINEEFATKTELQEIVVGQIPNNTITDAKLSQTGDNILPNFDAHVLSNTNKFAEIDADILSVKSNKINVLNFGADKTGALDSTEAFQDAIDYAILNEVTNIYAPCGVYRFDDASVSLNPGGGNLTFSGDGCNSTIFLFEEGNGDADEGLEAVKSLFYNVTATEKGSLEFYGIQFKGTFSTDNTSRGGPPLTLWYYDEINIHDCKFFDLSFMATWCECISRVKFQNNHCERVVRDMCRFRSSFDVIVTGNTFKHCDDDAVALHQHPLLLTPAKREGIVVSDNIFEDTCGISILGGRTVDIHDNIMRRVKSSPIRVVGDTAEGANPMFGISVHDNIINDSLNRAPFTSKNPGVIQILGIGQKGGSETSSIIPTQNNTLSKTHILPFAYRNKNHNLSTDSIPPTFNVKVYNNVIARTLPAATNYSDWGYGEAFSSTGFSDPAVGDTHLIPTSGLVIDGNGRNVEVKNNIFSDLVSCVNITAPTTNFALYNTRIEGNTFYNYVECAIVAYPLASAYSSSTLVIKNNIIDADPYHVHTNRGATGTWTSYTFPYGIALDKIKGAIIESNCFKNLFLPIDGTYVESFVYKNNVLRCDPTAIGWDASNKGIGSVNIGHLGWIHEIYGCDPTNANYMTQLNYTLQSTSNGSPPTSGKYVTGHFVQNCGFGYGTTIYGWIRLTTGSNHVSGTDWKAIALT